ncbi:hypothetical protein ES703_111180 [subsurface metagenome]
MKQDLYQASDIQRYPIGFKYPISDPLDLRGFHYGQAANTQIPDVGSHISLTQHVSWAVVADTPVGSRTVVVTVGGGDGAAHNGAIAENELAGGHCVLTPHTANHAMRRMIKSNTAVPATGGAMTITLDKPTDYILELVSHIEAMANPFLLLEQGDFDRQPVMGIPMLEATVNQFLWYQTWGPIWVAPQSADPAWIGVGNHNITVVFRHDGTLQALVVDAASSQQQHAGFVMTIPNGAGQAAPFIFLQITP